MTSITEFIDENDITAEDVIDALDIDAAQFADYPDGPQAFYDDPKVDDLREDFDAVDMLADRKAELVEEVDALQERLREARRPTFADKAEELADLTTRWGDKEELLEKFDAEDTDERWTVDDLEAKIELAEDIYEDLSDAETTTVGDSGTEGGDEGNEHDANRTATGGFDLRRRTKTE